MHIAIMNFRDGTIHIRYIDEQLTTTAQIEQWLWAAGFNIDEVQYMTSETPFKMVEAGMPKLYTERDMENAFEAGEVNRTPEGFQRKSSSAWVAEYKPEEFED